MREEGYYWILFDRAIGHEVAFYSLTAKAWRVCGAEYNLYDDDLFEIDERRIVREVE